MTRLEELKAASADADAAKDAANVALAYAADDALAAYKDALDAAYAAFVVALDAYVSELKKQENTHD